MGGLVWLASYPKSGNTWLRAFLHNLLRDEDEPVDINAFMQLSVGDTLREWYSEVAGGDIDELSDDDIAQLRPQVHRRLTEISKNSVFVKTHNYLGTDRGVPLITMAVTVGAIYVVRNPLDLVLSLAPHFGLSIDGAIKLMASEKGGSPADRANVAQRFSSWSSHVKSWTRQSHDRIHVVRYEDMHVSPFETFEGIAKFLALEVSIDRIEKAIRFSSFDVLRAQEDQHGFRERSIHADKFFRAGKTGSWRDVLSSKQIAAIIDRHRAQMANFDYLPK